MDLFSFGFEEAGTQSNQDHRQPLAARMRPRNLNEFIGQEHILGVGKLLRRAIEADQISSLIFYGPPGTGKTTLAKVISGVTLAAFTELNAVTAGVADIRKVVEEAKERSHVYRKRTTLFVDEIHRFNKAQQDALLPYVEEGTIILIGATTENPFFEVNSALLSRSQVFQLYPLEPLHMERILHRALTDITVGYGELNIQLTEEAKEHFIQYAEGDARRLLNALELAVITTVPNEQNIIVIDLEAAVDSIQRRAVRYDKSGDRHYDTISAFIKSIRGSDPDAALYWLAQMLDAGEEPLFIARRVVIAASEDVGNANPEALQIAVSAFQAVQFLGMPEARIPLAQAVTYCAISPKSNAAYNGINRALEWVRTKGHGQVPNHLKDASYKGASKLGHGEGYLYPHSYPGSYVEQRYLPDDIDERFYVPTENGEEKRLNDYLKSKRGEKKQ
ncbi:replication-associated recombination protein A [Ammoniphilus sp. CFH 90114]|uniref:replication-associated recombination protein A n=1 Tax=Ammoniphilus sp. CFH 90114 TaxID=2493665 RepID=UPI00100DE864|nr:replication-associated recombination protein A [Ammoniphilus sp. CFH 90114]RXT14765.1 replication-associated recombination protein A [Ammoniphilus sp. CFH 90114]